MTEHLLHIGSITEEMHLTFQQMFPTFVDEETDQLKLLTEKYHKYKREYLKHLCFNPEGENLSKYFITLRDEAYAGISALGHLLHVGPA